MIDGRCVTNLDKFWREEWPRDFAFAPRVGDSVESRSGKKLSVVQVTHLFDGTIEVELHWGRLGGPLG